MTRVRSTPRRVLGVTLAALAVLVAAIVGSLAVGVEPLRLGEALADPASTARLVLTVRASRVALGALVGAALAPSGVAFQALLRNPLADPYVLGVSAGAAIAGTLVLVLGGAETALGTWALPVWAFAGALASISVVFTFGRVRGVLVPNVALLTGVVVNALAGAVIIFVRLVARPHSTNDTLVWLTGAIGSTDGLRLGVLAAYVLVGLAVLCAQAVAMNAFALGDEAAHVVGVDTDGARVVIFLAASLLTGAAVAFAGPIGFVGIVVPHVLRGLWGPDHRVLLPASALVGAAFVVVADTAARLAFLALDTEPTVGVLTALTGAPFFLFVLRRRGAERVF
jgi:iron complex transport system permease protein